MYLLPPFILYNKHETLVFFDSFRGYKNTNLRRRRKALHFLKKIFMARRTLSSASAVNLLGSERRSSINHSLSHRMPSLGTRLISARVT